MKKLLILLALAAISASIGFTYAKRRPTFEVFGTKVIVTDASSSIVARACYDAAHSLSHWNTNADGTISNPSFHEEGENYSTRSAKGGEETPRSVGRGRTEFNDEKGNHIVIETIASGDTSRVMPTVVLFSPLGTDDAYTVLNAFSLSLQRQGVKPILP